MKEVRVIININRYILTYLTYLTSFCTLARIGQKFSVYSHKILKLISICPVFRGKRGKEVRAGLLITLFLLPLLKNRGKSREEGGKR
jgi:hypothetical protein